MCMYFVLVIETEGKVCEELKFTQLVSAGTIGGLHRSENSTPAIIVSTTET